MPISSLRSSISSSFERLACRVASMSNSFDRLACRATIDGPIDLPQLDFMIITADISRLSSALMTCADLPYSFTMRSNSLWVCFTVMPSTLKVSVVKCDRSAG